MADIIELSNAAYEARDEAQARIILLREKAEKEYQTYFQEIKELDRALEQDRKLKDFMATKVLDRQEKAEGKDGANKDLSSHHEKDSSNKNMPSTEVLAESVETYERAFEEIRKVTGSSDIGELVQRFKAIEDQNFSLFNYVNEINNEVECCAEDIVKIQNHIDEMKIENVKTEESRKKLMKSLEEQLSHTNSRCSQYESQYNEVTFLISDLRKAVEGLIFNLQHTRLPSMSPRKPAQSSSQNSTHPTTPAHPSLSSGGLDETAEGAESHEAKDEDGHESSEEYNSSSREALSKAATDSGEEQNAEADQAEQERKVDYVISADMIPGGVVTDTNLLQVLGIVEQKTNELLTMHYIFNAPKKSGSSAPSGSAGVEDKGELGKEGVVITTGGVGGLLGLGPQPTVNNLSIMAPTIGDDQYSDDNMSEDDDRPMTRDELMQKTMKGLSKREKNAGVKIGGGKNKRKGPKTKALE
ncbi:uncharacterized protein BJ171DRAFT_158220 [Polychytrium aggregatum]|uniref:uncharacterized protein n=1 Tax=Polychytrium aggregatum TaxID=110093 RepID=UPI0022FE4971|nr:uncharacterized protein BJ171DRAFT_158220 [Polychytrium aggregatum]KAI9203021.1 hypothetical protein BJ171DRAFT_158220 [Polychytrium aggregatum]